ncbi:TetR/AcrR family transcriptional regulator [Curtobacterium sp. NPDC090217]|uniref:TetR/AcrR family transcriptional regulator n=1 Tax=Curtobacterium sp. NPDC090217 TaxID=3363970 RepID=UPI0038124CF0
MTREQWVAHLEQASSRGSGAPVAPVRSRRGREPITTERIVAAALDTVQETGFEDLTMRSVAAALDTGPASLYAHVRSKAELGDLLVGELCSRVHLPRPDADHWQEQFIALCAGLRDQFLAYPGVARAALAVVPADFGTLRVAEALLATLRTGGVQPRQAAWASDAAFLYICAYCLEAADGDQQRRDVSGTAIGAEEIATRLQMLPADTFPHTIELSRDLTAGDGHDRFAFTLDLIVRGLDH